MFRKHLFVIVFVFNLTITVFCLEQPSYKVTFGSHFTVNSSDLGLDTFDGRTRVFTFVGRKRKNIKSSISQDRKSLNCIWNYNFNSGLYSLYVQTKDENNEIITRKLSDFFAILPPSIKKVSPVNATGGQTLTVSGAFFSSKCKVYLGTDEENLQHCGELTPKNDIMDSDTGDSSVEISIPKNISSVNGLVIKVISDVGSDTETIDANLAADNATAYILSVGDIHETSKYLAKVSDFISTFKQTQNNLTLALYGGDILSAYPKTSWDPDWARDLYTADADKHGLAIMEAMAEIDFDVVTIGNHDPCLGYKRFSELLELFPLNIISNNLFKYSNNQFIQWTNPGVDIAPSYLSFQLQGLDVGVVAVSSTEQDHWTDADKSAYRVLNTLNERNINNIRSCALFNDIVILISHEDDVSAIIPVYGTPTPTGEYLVNSDIYTLKDLQNVVLMVGGHEHKNYFRRASYALDNAKYALYTDKIYNPDSKLVLIKSSKFYGEYVGVIRILWGKSSKSVSSIKLMDGSKDAEGKYLGCASDQMYEVADDGLFQELDEAVWDPTVETKWWRMDDWPTSDQRIKEILSKHKK